LSSIELAKQIKDIAERLLKDSNSKGIVPSKRSKEKSKAGQIIVTTPSFLSTNTKPSQKTISLEQTTVFVLDEADAIIKLENTKRISENLCGANRKNPNLGLSPQPSLRK
jgi:superfamily II DNA/RNA helicase